MYILYIFPDNRWQFCTFAVLEVRGALAPSAEDLKADSDAPLSHFWCCRQFVLACWLEADGWRLMAGGSWLEPEIRKLKSYDFTSEI